MNDKPHPMQPIVALWGKKIEAAIQAKSRFTEDADVGMKFLRGDVDFMFKYSRADSGEQRGMRVMDEQGVTPTFQVEINKTAELQAIYGGLLYHRNPIRKVMPRPRPKIDWAALSGGSSNPAAVMFAQMMVEQEHMEKAVLDAKAKLFEAYLNYTPNELGLFNHSRFALNEAIIKGRGLLVTEYYQKPQQQMRMVGSFFESVDNLVIDPDLDNGIITDAKWIAIKCSHPVWELERIYGLRPGSLNGNYESFSSSASVKGSDNERSLRQCGHTNDLLTYWKIFSRMGVGDRLSGADERQRGVFDMFGDNVYLVIAKDIPYPLNLPPEIMDLPMTPEVLQEMTSRLSWPSPVWADGRWPVSILDFYNIPRDPWALSITAMAAGELKFINWAMSFLAGKVRTTCRDFIALAKSLSEEFKSQIAHGKDLTVLELELQGKKIDEMVQFLQHPGMNRDILDVLRLVIDAYEKGTGLTEAMYGQSRVQIRSAEEAAQKGNMTRIRPDDMANRVEDFMTDVARSEAILASRLDPMTEIAPVLGVNAAKLWAQLITPMSIHDIVNEFDFRIEAGSARKPNKDADKLKMSDGAQFLLPTLQNNAQVTGDIGPVNAFIREWCEANDIDAEPFESMPIPPPPAPAEGAAA